VKGVGEGVSGRRGELDETGNVETEKMKEWMNRRQG
jgi:hypothetical protein